MEADVRVLVTEGSGLTARQSATVLAAAGHEVGALSSDPWCLCRFTKHVRAVHPVANFGEDPFGWLTMALDTYERGRYDVLLPTQEQVTVLAAARGRLEERGVVTAVPPFEAVVRVQDKMAAHTTLRELGLPQPEAVVLKGPAELANWRRFPVYLKTPVGTASGGVRRVESAADIARIPEAWARDGVLAQLPASGRLAMVQSVFADGQLVAFHANERVREGIRGGASHKRSRDLPEAREIIAELGRRLDWHGALSADVILTENGPVVIDVNPRLVEPINALRSGTDLVSTLLEVAKGAAVERHKPSTEDVRTHQLLLALLGAAAAGRRRAVVGELWAAATKRGAYRDSTEELTPNAAGDPRTAVLLALATAAVVVRPRTWTWFAGGAVSAYALTPHAWERIVADGVMRASERRISAGDRVQDQDRSTS
jgi:glutathione synthase/RimK-type ligase-like ATP-grasp enzyme